MQFFGVIDNFPAEISLNRSFGVGNVGDYRRDAGVFYCQICAASHAAHQKRFAVGDRFDHAGVAAVGVPPKAMALTMRLAMIVVVVMFMVVIMVVMRVIVFFLRKLAVSQLIA